MLRLNPSGLDYAIIAAYFLVVLGIGVVARPMPDIPDGQPFRAPITAQPTGDNDVDEAAAARAANRFDIRRIIGGVFTVYGIVLGILGLFGAHQIKVKADASGRARVEGP